MHCSFFGIDLRFPVMIAPSAMHGQAHEQAERASARAAVRAGSAFMLSSLASVSMEDVAQAVPTERDGRPKGLIFQPLGVDVDAKLISGSEALRLQAP